MSQSSHFGKSFSKWLPSIAQTVTTGMRVNASEDKRIKKKQETQAKVVEKKALADKKLKDASAQSKQNLQTLYSGKTTELSPTMGQPKVTEFGVNTVDINKPLQRSERDLTNVERGSLASGLNTKDYRGYTETNRLNKADAKLEADKIKANEPKFITRSGKDGLYQYEVNPNGSIKGSGKLVKPYTSGRDDNNKLTKKWMDIATKNVLDTKARYDLTKDSSQQTTDLEGAIDYYAGEVARSESNDKIDATAMDLGHKTAIANLNSFKTEQKKAQDKIDLAQSQNNTIMMFNSDKPKLVEKMIGEGQKTFKERNSENAMAKMLTIALDGGMSMEDMPMLRLLIINNAMIDPANSESTNIWNEFKQKISEEVYAK